MTPRSRRSPSVPRDQIERATWPVKRTISYGGVVVRSGASGIEVALIRTRGLRGNEVWGLPKGQAEEGEAPEGAAVREVREETGLDAEIVASLHPITYWFYWPPEQVRYRKTVHHFLMRALGGDVTRHDTEVLEAKFVPLEDAVRLASYRTDQQILRKVAEAELTL